MRVAIIGAGKVGAALARGLSGKGHQLTLGVRDPEREDMKALAAATGAALALPVEAAVGAEVVVLALPWRVAEGAVKALGDLSGKVVIDCMNPLGMVDGALGLVVGHTTSGAEVLQGWMPKARGVKTLNQVGAEIMARNAHLPQRPVQFVAGDDQAAKDMAIRLLADLGFEALDAGALRQARILEPLALVWINQAVARGKGRNWALAAVSGT
jgi:predicted dinucleotide-binding enzyme